MKKILVVDDDLLFRGMILMALEEAGFETIEADNGQTGITLAREQHPALIICDVQMDHVDGYGVLAALRDDPATAAIPFILMTGMADPQGMREGMNRGADDYLPKPFSVDSLLSAVQARLQKQQTLRQQAEQKLEELRASITLALPHELRTPLHGIIGGAQVLRDDVEAMSVQEIREFAGIIHESGKRLHRLTENFLIYAQIEMLARDPHQVARLKSEQARTPASVIEQVVHLGAERHGRRQDLHLELEPARCGPVAISEDYLGKILDELVDNAFKFSVAGDRVTVGAQTVTGGLRLTIRDEGVGMDVQRVADLGAYMQFERAVQEQQGTGLGLQIVKQLLHLHGGTLGLRSTPGTGTQVEVTLPAVATSSSASTSA